MWVESGVGQMKVEIVRLKPDATKVMCTHPAGQPPLKLQRSAEALAKANALAKAAAGPDESEMKATRVQA